MEKENQAAWPFQAPKLRIMPKSKNQQKVRTIKSGQAEQQRNQSPVLQVQHANHHHPHRQRKHSNFHIHHHSNHHRPHHNTVMYPTQLLLQN